MDPRYDVLRLRHFPHVEVFALNSTERQPSPAVRGWCASILPKGCPRRIQSDSRQRGRTGLGEVSWHTLTWFSSLGAQESIHD